MLTVAELMAKLEQMPKDAIVTRYYWDDDELRVQYLEPEDVCYREKGELVNTHAYGAGEVELFS